MHKETRIADKGSFCAACMDDAGEANADICEGLEWLKFAAARSPFTCGMVARCAAYAGSKHLKDTSRSTRCQRGSSCHSSLSPNVSSCLTCSCVCVCEVVVVAGTVKSACARPACALIVHVSLPSAALQGVRDL
eukprot:scaffold156763_cov18-Tisochrysis_lutea.AAC.1